MNNGRYRIDSFIARGGMGSIYRASDLNLGKACAIKELLDEGDQSDRARNVIQFRQEAQILASIRHPNIVHLWDFFENNDRYYLVEEFLPGGDLSKPSTPLSEPQIIEIAIAIAKALSHLHEQNIVYRDLKPANVLRRADGSVVLADFGIARIFDAAKQTNTQMFATEGYAPPEMYSRHLQTGPVSDVYAFGATIHELITGSPPTAWREEGEAFIKLPPVATVATTVSAPLAGLLDKCLSFRVAERPKDGRALLDVLEPLAHQWKLARCRNEHQNLLGALKCEVCGVTLAKSTAWSATVLAPNLWGGTLPLVLAWSKPIGSATRGSPSIISGTIFVATEGGDLVEIDLTGTIRRRLSLGAPSRSTPVPGPKGLLIGTELGLRTEDAWLYKGSAVFAPPVVRNGFAYFSTYDGQLICLDSSGSVRWTNNMPGQGIHTPKQIGDDFLGSTKDGYLCRVKTDGHIIWETSVGEQMYASPIVTDVAIVVADRSGRFRLFDTQNGRQFSQTQLVDGLYATPGFDANGFVIAGYEGSVVYLNTDLSERWRVDLRSSVLAAPVVVNDYVFLCDSEGGLQALNISDGRQVWESRTEAEWVASPVIDGNSLLGLTRDGALHCFVGQG